MRLALFADIHSNLEAMAAFIEDASSRHIHRYICLGDIVGYGADPNECIRLVRSLPKMNCVLGNHDAAAVWRYSPYGMTRDAQEVILWTIDQLTRDNADYLKNLPPVLKLVNMFFAHANPYNPEAYRYVINKKYAARSFGAVKEKLTFIGHSHRPVVITRKNLFQITFHTPRGSEKKDLHKGKKQIINCGSIGQPRDGDPRACYCVVDTENETVEFHRVDYDFHGAVDKIKQAGLPDILARRLIRGR
jgi:diadenosine tetraphosphatase ApaH/serine/threonine PP2A family protein phosphatase